MINLFDLYAIISIMSIVMIVLSSEAYYKLQEFPVLGVIFRNKPFNCVLCSTFWSVTIYLYSHYGLNTELLMAFPSALVSEYIWKKLIA